MMIYLFVSQCEQVEVETFLAQKRYFDYNSLLVFPIDIVPNLDQKGNILFRDPENLSFSSIGSGAFMQCLKKDGLLGHMKSSGVDTVQIVNMEHVNVDLAKPHLLGYLADKGPAVNMLAELSLADPGFPEHPAIVLDVDTNKFTYCQPFALAKMRDANGNPFFTKYQSHSTNVYMKVTLIEDCITNHKSEIFQYRIKERNLGCVDTEITNSPLKINTDLPRFYTFEFNLFNVLKMSPKVKFILQDKELVQCILPRL